MNEKLEQQQIEKIDLSAEIEKLNGEIKDLQNEKLNRVGQLEANENQKLKELNLKIDTLEQEKLVSLIKWSFLEIYNLFF